MRIIAGEFRSRTLTTPPDDRTTRPMPDSVRESLFNLLRGHFQGQRVVDVFAGTGASGLEALSRGAASCVFIEKDKQAERTLRANIETLGVEDRTEVVRADAMGNSAIGACPTSAHLVFFDPPYHMMRDAAQRERCLASLARFIEKLDETGYAILRTPWPLPSDESDDADTSDDTGDVDLRLPGAVGPETHVHSTMALHLYMRDPNQSHSEP